MACGDPFHILDFALAQTNFPAKRNKCAIPANSFHTYNFRRLFRAAEDELRLVASFLAWEQFNQFSVRQFVATAKPLNSRTEMRGEATNGASLAKKVMVSGRW